MSGAKGRRSRPARATATSTSTLRPSWRRHTSRERPSRLPSKPKRPRPRPRPPSRRMKRHRPCRHQRRSLQPPRRLRPAAGPYTCHARSVARPGPVFRDVRPQPHRATSGPSRSALRRERDVRDRRPTTARAEPVSPHRQSDTPSDWVWCRVAQDRIPLAQTTM